MIPAERAASRSSPIEVLVVSVSRERGRPSLFAAGEDEGLIRIGAEVFYFEDPTAGAGGGSSGTNQGTLRLTGAQQVQSAAQQAGAQALTFAEEAEQPASSRNIIQDQFPPEGVSSSGRTGHFEAEGFARIEAHNEDIAAFHEVFFYKRLGSGFSRCLRGQFETPILGGIQSATVYNATRRLRLVGRSLLGSEAAAHGLGDPCAHLPYLTVAPVTGPLTDTGLPVKRAERFSRSGGYAMIDSGQPGIAWEIIAHLGPTGEGLLGRPRDERGHGIFRSSFGTPIAAISAAAFAYDMPYRYPDRYEPEVESESLAFLEKSFRVPSARWRGIEWLQRPSRTLRERRADIVVVARFDGEPAWDSKPTNAHGGLWLLEDKDRDEKGPARFDLDEVADQMEVRIYFRYPSGAFTRMPQGMISDDWKETPVLEYLTVEYDKPSAIVRHEELPF
jgi:hypothetical protein